MKIYSGKMELFESGIAQTAFENTLTFDFEDITFEIVFVIDKIKKTREREFKLNDDKSGIIMTLINFTDSKPSGLIEPVEIGEYKNRPLYFNYRAYRVNSDIDSWIVSYFFYLGELSDGK